MTVQTQPKSVRPPLERETIRVGIVGTKFGGSVHLPGLLNLPGVQVTAVCSADLRNAKAIAGKNNIPATFDDYRVMFESGTIDAVTIAAPPHMHHSMVLAACESGIHILCEKPLSVSAAEARDMLKMAEDAGICHAVAFQRRWEPARIRMKQLVEQGFIGDLHSVSVIVYRSSLSAEQSRQFDWMMQREKGGGVLAAVGSHYIDNLRWWFGEIHAVAGATLTAVARRVDQEGMSRREADSDDNVALVLQFASGAIGTITISYTAVGDIGEELVASGSDGMLAIQGHNTLLGTRRGGQVQSMIDQQKASLPAGQREVVPFRQLAAGWINAIRNGTEASPSFNDGAKVQEVVDAVTRSQDLNRWIDLSGRRWPMTG